MYFCRNNAVTQLAVDPKTGLSEKTEFVKNVFRLGYPYPNVF